MIQIKFNKGENTSENFNQDIVSGETLKQAVERSLVGIDLGDKTPAEVFTVVLNGKIIPADMWEFCNLSGADNVLITPTLKGGDNGGLFRQIAILAITIGAAALLGPGAGGIPGLGLTGVGLGVATAAVSIGAGLLINGLFPPPSLDQNGLGGFDEVSTSQMYSITGQSNKVAIYKTVPKVYGEHRIFPNIASNPYTDLETDPATGELSQYLYAIYDLGLGPGEVRDIRIGDTSLSDFSDVAVRLVDFNKPAISEGPWDDALNDSLLFYKGDPQVEQVAVALNANQIEGGPAEGYTVTRNSAPNNENLPQEIQLTFVNPRGLFAFNSNGQISERTINLEIYFAEVGTEDWKAFNDLNEVDTFSAAGGNSAFALKTWTIPKPEKIDSSWNIDTGPNANYAKINQGGLKRPWYFEGPWRAYFLDARSYVRDTIYGIPAASNKIYFYQNNDQPYAPVLGQTVFYKGSLLGLVQSATLIPAGPTVVDPYYEVTLQAPVGRDIPLYTYEVVDPASRTLTQNIGRTIFYAPNQETESLGFEIGPPILGKAQISRAENNPTYSTFKFTPKLPGQYKVRVVRTSSSSSFTNTIQDELSLIGITTRFDRDPIVTDKRHLFLEVRIRATNQLNGNITNLSATVSSVLDVYDPDTETWSKQVTNNPAWVYVDLLTGEINKRPLPKSRLHLDSILEWAEYCEEVPDSPPSIDFYKQRFETNFVLDYSGTVQSVIAQVASAAQASLNIIDGKYGVLIDRKKEIPVQLFTPRNSRDFTSNRIYSQKPDALKVKYINPGKDWSVDEVTVYDSGFNELNALEFEEITSFACTNDEQAWRFGRYILAQNRLRQETIQITVDFESLVCTRGDFVQITQDVMKVGGVPARVKKINVSGNPDRIQIDDGFEIDLDIDYGYVYRSPAGEIKTGTCTPVSSDTFDLDDDIPAVGDLIVIGEVGKVVYDCVVKSISPNDNFSATLTLVEKADAIFDAESTDTFPDYDPLISQASSPDGKPPGEVQNLIIADSGFECSDAGYEYFTLLDWDAPLGSVYEIFEVLVDDGRGFTLVASTRDSFYRYVISPTRLGYTHKYKVLAVSVTGKKLELGAISEVTNTPTLKTTPPSDVDFLATDITGEVLQFSWNQVNDCDVREYLIRYSPNLAATWNSSIPLLRVDRNTTLASTQARTGIYFIKAVDFNGNESANAASALTTIPNLFNLNIIEETTDFPDLLGVFDRTEKQGDTLVLSEEVVGGVGTNEYYSEGYYYYESLLDLSEIYTVRLQSLIQAEGYTIGDLMVNWVTLDAVQFLSNTKSSEWDVEAQYRSTDVINVMANWVTLDSIDPISEGVQDNFTEWRKFVMGDATARIFQFRLKLVSNKPNVTPRVFDGTIRADMPDRSEAFGNLVATDTDGYELIYSPAFAGPNPGGPAIQISIDGAESGDTWAFDYRNNDGFKIRFFDQNGDPVERTFDAAVKGYGRKSNSVI